MTASISAAVKRTRLLYSAASVHTHLYTIAGSGGKCTTYCFHARITDSNGSYSQCKMGLLLPCLICTAPALHRCPDRVWHGNVFSKTCRSTQTTTPSRYLLSILQFCGTLSGLQQVVVVLGVEDRNQGVVRGLGHRHEQARVLGDIPPGQRGDRADESMIDRGHRDFPEAGDRRLLGGAVRAVLAAEGFDLVVVTGPHGTRERRRAGMELAGAG